MTKPPLRRSLRRIQMAEKEQQLKFRDLPPDLQVNVLKFLPFREKVRFERVSRKWSSNLEILWRKVERLNITFNPRLELEECKDEEHHFSLNDIFIDDGSHFTHMKRTFLQIIRRCPNLRVLRFNSSFVCSPFFGADIAKLCPLLEHVSFSDVNAFRAFTTYPSALESECRIKCVLITEPDTRMTLEGFTDDIENFLCRCPQLQYLHNMSCSNSVGVLKRVSRRVKHLHIQKPSCKDFELREVLINVKRLESFSCREDLTPRIVELIMRIPPLESVGVVAKQEMLNVFGSYRKSLKEISLWSGSDETAFTYATCQVFIRENASSLQVLHLHNINMTCEQMTALLRMMSNLKSLELTLNPSITLTPAVVDSFSRLPLLERLLLDNTIFTTEQFSQILMSLISLEELHLINIGLTSEMSSLIRGHGRRYPNRVFRVFVDHRILETAFLDSDPLHDSIQVFENIYAIFSH